MDWQFTPYTIPIFLAVIFLISAIGIYFWWQNRTKKLVRQRAIQLMENGIIALDNKNQITDINLSAEHISGREASKVIGKYAPDVFLHIPEIVEAITSETEAPKKFSIGIDQETRFYELKISQLRDSLNRSQGRLITISDITSQEHAERSLQSEGEIAYRRSRQLEATAQVAREAAAIRDLDQLLTKACQLISDQFGFYHTGIFLLDNNNEYAVLQAANSEGGQRMLERGHKLHIGRTSIVGYVAMTGEPRIALDVGEDAVYFDNPDLQATRSEMSLPLKIREDITGILDVQSTDPGAFSIADIETLQIMADQIALAIENARLFEQSKKAIANLEALYGQKLRQSWRQQLGTQSRAFYYDRLRVTQASRDHIKSIKSYQTDEPMIRTDENGSHIIVPILIRGQRIGNILLRRQPEEDAWSKEDLAIAAGTADQIAVALDNTRLLEATQRLVDQEQTISMISTRLSRSMDIDSILRSVVQELGQLPSVAEASVHISPPEK
jgi:PAS domain S-box-containing protein